MLIGIFRFPPLEAVILNKATSLVVGAAAVVFRSAVVPAAELRPHAAVIVDLLVGSLTGAWLAAGWATRLPRERFHRVIAVLLVGIAAVLLFGHGVADGDGPWLDGPTLWAVGIAAGFLVGAAASLSGVAGGELPIPTIVLLFGPDLRLAGSLALAVSLPTMLAGFARYSRDASFVVLRRQLPFLAVMAAGSICGAWMGARLLGVVPEAVLLPLLAAILVISAAKLWRHG